MLCGIVLVVGIDERELDIIALVHDHERPGHRAVEGHGLEFRALLVDDDFFLLDRERELHDYGDRGGRPARAHGRKAG